MFVLNAVFSRRCRAFLFAVFFLAGCASAEDRAQRHYERGSTFLSQKDYVKAGLEFKTALQLKKNLVEAWRGLSQIEEHNKNWAGVAEALRSVVELDPKDIPSRLRLARLLTDGNALDEALALVDAAAAIDDRNANVLLTRAIILAKRNDMMGAVHEARAALEIDSNNVEATMVLATERMLRRDPEGALALMETGPAAQSKELAVHIFKLMIIDQIGKPEKLEAEVRKTIELHPHHSVFRKQLAFHLFKQKRYDDVEKELRAWAAGFPDETEAEQHLIQFLRQTKGPESARQELLSRISLGGPRAFQRQMILANFDIELGNLADGILLLEKLAGATSHEDATAARVRLAEIQISQKQFNEADALIGKILGQDARNNDGLRLRAVLRMEQGKLDAAIIDVRQALSDQPKSAALMLVLAAAYERNGSIELADKQYADATKASDLGTAVGLQYVGFLRRRGNVERAEDTLNELLRRSPNDIALLSALAEVRLSRENWIGAQIIAERIREVGGARSAVVADNVLAAAFSGRGRYDDSIKVLENVYAAVPGAASIRSLVRTLVQAQKLDQAVTLLHTVLQANPADAQAHALLGSVQLLQKSPDAALQSFRAAIDYEPKSIIGYQALANFYSREKKFDEALKVIRIGLQQQPDSLELRGVLASVLELSGDYETAIAEYEFMLTKNPGSMAVINNLASLLAEHRTDKASLERAHSLAMVLRNTPVPFFKDTLGWIYYQRGNFKEASPLLEEAAAGLPNHAAVQYHLGMNYLATGARGKASEQFEKSLRLTTDDGLQQKIRAAQQKLN